jgi:hypothetical protein
MRRQRGKIKGSGPAARPNIRPASDFRLFDHPDFDHRTGSGAFLRPERTGGKLKILHGIALLAANPGPLRRGMLCRRLSAAVATARPASTVPMIQRYGSAPTGRPVSNTAMEPAAQAIMGSTLTLRTIWCVSSCRNACEVRHSPTRCSVNATGRGQANAGPLGGDGSESHTEDRHRADAGFCIAIDEAKTGNERGTDHDRDGRDTGRLVLADIANT